MTDLTTRECKPCEGGVQPLDRATVETYMPHLHADWTLGGDGGEIARDYRFSNFYETMAFVNAVAWVAHVQDHHPDLEVGYRHCLVRYSTHAIGGLSENDFICAARTDALLGA